MISPLEAVRCIIIYRNHPELCGGLTIGEVFDSVTRRTLVPPTSRRPPHDPPQDPTDTKPS